MKNLLYVPVDCPRCHKRSIFALTVAAVEVALQSDSPILFKCGFDGASWIAGLTERHRIGRLKAEQSFIGTCSWLRLRPSASEQRTG
jgi:hypothetical protein